MMLQLELLWTLQCIDNEISRIKKDTRSRELSSRLSEIKSEHAGIKKALEKDISELDANSKMAIRLNVDLKHLDDKVKENEKKLYKEGANIKIIESLQKEIESYKKIIDEKENELLRIIEMDDTTKQSINNKKAKLSLLKKEFDGLKSEYVQNNESKQKELEELNRKKDSVIKEIDGVLVKQYVELSLKRNNPVSRVSSGICTECGVKLNAVLYDKLKKKNEISICDHCGRILYMGNIPV